MADLGEFLRARRARTSPESAGVLVGVRRRVPGLRREELAQLAGISVEYYQRLEQGRAKSPSPQVLDAIADALDLTPVERDHLQTLAAQRPEPQVHPESSPAVMERIVQALGVPALVINDRFDVLAANAIARRLFAVAEPGWNLARRLFFDDASRDFYVEWDEVAAATVGQLRFLTGRYPDDACLDVLVRELRAGSATFRAHWSAGDVTVRTQGTKSFRHPALGVLTFDYVNLPAAGDPRCRLVAFTPEPGSPTEAALQLLATWSAGLPGVTRR